MAQALEKKERGGLTLLTFNRPQIGNALSEELIGLLHEELKSLGKKDSVSGVVFLGNGPKFCTGADLNEMREKREKFSGALGVFFETMEMIQKAPFFTASFVHGDCLGGGLGIALCNDYLLASRAARFGTPEITRGLFPFLISRFLIDKIGLHSTNTLCFGGKFLSIDEAIQHKIPSEVVSESDFSKRSEELLSLWEKVPATTLRNGKKVLLQQGKLSEETLVQHLMTALKGLAPLPP